MNLSTPSLVLVGVGLILTLAPHVIQRVLLRLYGDGLFGWAYRGALARISYVVLGLAILAILLVPPIFGNCISCEAKADEPAWHRSTRGPSATLELAAEIVAGRRGGAPLVFEVVQVSDALAIAGGGDEILGSKTSERWFKKTWVGTLARSLDHAALRIDPEVQLAAGGELFRTGALGPATLVRTEAAGELRLGPGCWRGRRLGETGRAQTGEDGKTG